MQKIKKPKFKLKNVVLLLGLASLMPGYSASTSSLGPEGKIYASPEYGNPQHLLVYGQFLNSLQPDLQANIINDVFFGSNSANIFYGTPVTVAIQSTYGINFLEEGATLTYPTKDIEEQDNFAYYQYEFNEGVLKQYQGISGISLNVSTQNANNLVSQPSIKSIQEVEPVDSNDGNMPIYHIVVNSGYGVQDSTANSTVASAYYFNAYDSSPFDNSSVGDSVIEPLSVIPDPNDGSDYGLSQADFYYHGDLKNIGIYQNVNYFPEQDNYSSSMYSGSDTQSLSKATPPTPPAGAASLSAKDSLAIQLAPVDNATSSMADPIYANGMNQAPFTVQILLNGSPISPSDSQYGWLYHLVYFADATTDNVITNFAQNNGAEAVTVNQGPYTKAINNNGVSLPALKSTNGDSQTFYYSNTSAGNYNIIAKLEAPVSGGNVTFVSSSPLTFQVENNAKLSATSVSFPNSDNTSSGSMSFSNNIQNASNSSPATYLNLNNPAHPVYIGFVRYANVSAYNYYASNASPYYVVNLNGANYSINGSGLSFSYNYQALGIGASYANEMAIDVVDEFGNLYQTPGYGD